MTPSSSRRMAWAPVALLLLVALFLFPYLFQGKSLVPLDLIPRFQPWAHHSREIWGERPLPHNPLLDSIQQYYPRRVLFTEGLRDGKLPLWNPYVYGGSSFVGSQQGALLYPPAWLLALLSPAVQFGWSAALHLGLALLGAFAFFRQLGLRPVAAAAGGVAFAFNGFIVAWLAYPNVTQWTLCWLPLACFLWERARERGDLRWLAACALTLGVSVLGGHGQMSSFVLLGWGGWALSRTVAAERKLGAVAKWVVVPSVLALLLAVGQLLPAFDYLPRTDRGARVPWDAVVHAGMPPSQLLTMVLPRLFGDATLASAHQFWLPPEGKQGFVYLERTFYPGIAVMALGVGALAAARRNRGHRHLAIYGALLSLFALLCAMGTPLYWPLWAAVPGFGNFTAVARIIALAAWGLAVLAALGVHALTDQSLEVRRSAMRFISAASGALALVAVTAHFIHGGADPLQLAPFIEKFKQLPLETQATRDLSLALLWCALPAAAGALAIWRGGQLRWAGAVAVAAIVADLFAFGFPFNPRADLRLLEATTPETRILAEAVEAERKGTPQPFRFVSSGPAGQEDVFNQRMASNLPATLGLADLGGSDSFIPKRYAAWEAATAKAAGGSWLRPASANLRAAGVRYYLLGYEGQVAGLAPTTAPLLQEDLQAYSYARLHGFVQPVEAGQALENLSQPNRAPAVVLAEGDGAPQLEGAPRVIPFAAHRISSNRLVLEGESPHPGLLVVCEGFDPGWRATVDGRRSPVFPADHMFLGIPLEAGRHRVELTYQPEAWRVGLFGTLVGVALLGALGVCRRGRIVN